MAFTVKWSETAYEDLREIVQYIARDNPEAASKLADTIIYHIEIASEYPFSNRVVPEKGEDSMREAILKPYRIIYSIEKSFETIHILRIWNSYRGMPSIE